LLGVPVTRKTDVRADAVAVERRLDRDPLGGCRIDLTDRAREHLLTIFSAPSGQRFGTCSCGQWCSPVGNFTSDQLAGVHRGHLTAEDIDEH
jgi:hypothetical protein